MSAFQAIFAMPGKRSNYVYFHIRMTIFAFPPHDPPDINPRKRKASTIKALQPPNSAAAMTFSNMDAIHHTQNTESHRIPSVFYQTNLQVLRQKASPTELYLQLQHRKMHSQTVYSPKRT